MRSVHNAVLEYWGWLWDRRRTHEVHDDLENKKNNNKYDPRSNTKYQVNYIVLFNLIVFCLLLNLQSANEIEVDIMMKQAWICRELSNSITYLWDRRYLLSCSRLYSSSKAGSTNLKVHLLIMGTSFFLAPPSSAKGAWEGTLMLPHPILLFFFLLFLLFSFSLLFMPCWRRYYLCCLTDLWPNRT